MKDWKHAKNDGRTDVEYDFGQVDSGNRRVSDILNQGCYVFYDHAEGVWENSDKDSYAKSLADEFLTYPMLSARRLKCEDRMVKMIAYRALELIKQNSDKWVYSLSHVVRTGMRSRGFI